MYTTLKNQLFKKCTPPSNFLKPLQQHRARNFHRTITIHYTWVTFRLMVLSVFSSSEQLKELLAVLSSSRKSKLATASRSFSPYLVKKSGRPTIDGLLGGAAALTTASSGRMACAGRQYAQTAVSVSGVHGAEADAWNPERVIVCSANLIVWYVYWLKFRFWVFAFVNGNENRFDNLLAQIRNQIQFNKKLSCLRWFHFFERMLKTSNVRNLQKQLKVFISDVPSAHVEYIKLNPKIFKSCLFKLYFVTRIGSYTQHRVCIQSYFSISRNGKYLTIFSGIKI